MAENNQGKVNTNTQVRNMYSDGLSYLNMKFYGVNFSLQLVPFVSKDANGRSIYDRTKGVMTTIDYDAAYSIFKAANDIIQGKEAAQGLTLNIPCAAGAVVSLERKPGQSGQMETFFSISKNNITIPFKFNTHSYQVKENGQMVTKVIESGLGTLAKTLDGYLSGINADRHLDKLTEDYVKSKEGQGGAGGFQTGSGYQPKPWQNNGGGGYQKKPWQGNNGGYQKKPWQNNNNNSQGHTQPNNSWESKQPNQQAMSSYQIQN